MKNWKTEAYFVLSIALLFLAIGSMCGGFMAGNFNPLTALVFLLPATGLGFMAEARRRNQSSN